MIPNAMVGYHAGYGEAADCWPQGSNSSYMKMRLLVMVAVKNDLALVAAAVGPFRAFGPDGSMWRTVLACSAGLVRAW